MSKWPKTITIEVGVDPEENPAWVDGVLARYSGDTKKGGYSTNPYDVEPERSDWQGGWRWMNSAMIKLLREGARHYT